MKEPHDGTNSNTANGNGSTVHRHRRPSEELCRQQNDSRFPTHQPGSNDKFTGSNDYHHISPGSMSYTEELRSPAPHTRPAGRSDRHLDPVVHTGETQTAAATASDVTTADVTTADVTTADVTTADVTTADVTTADVTTADVTTAADITTTDVATAAEDTTTVDAATEATASDITDTSNIATDRYTAAANDNTAADDRDGPLTSNDSADNRPTANVNKDCVRHSSVPVSTGDSPVDSGRDGPPSLEPVQNEHQSRCAGLQATTVHGRALTRSQSLSTEGHTRNKQSCIPSNWVATPAAKMSENTQPSAQNSRKGKQWRFGPDPLPQLPNPGTKEVPGEFSMLLYNVEGIVSKLKDTSFVSFISCYDFVFMVETFVDTITSTLFPSFTSFVSPAKTNSHHGRRSGEVIVLVRNVLMRFIKQIEVDYDNVIILEVSKELLGTDANVFVVSTYLNPPNSPFYDTCDYDNGIAMWEQCLLSILEKNEDASFILCGDLNARTGSKVPSYFDFASSCFEAVGSNFWLDNDTSNDLSAQEIFKKMNTGTIYWLCAQVLIYVF